MRAYCKTCDVLMHRVTFMLLCMDTTPLKFILAMASASWAVLLLLPGDTFQRPVYRYMSLMVGGGEHAELWWVLAWGTYCVLMLWRTFEDYQAPRVALAVNILGVALFVGSTVAIVATKTFPFPAAVACDIALSFAAIWVLVRTNINANHGWRGD